MKIKTCFIKNYMLTRRCYSPLYYRQGKPDLLHVETIPRHLSSRLDHPYNRSELQYRQCALSTVQHRVQEARTQYTPHSLEQRKSAH